MKLPAKIRVGYKVYDVEDWDRKEAEGACMVGVSSFSRSQIKVCRDFGDEETFNTLIHEIFHCCYKVGDLEPGNSEEKVITVMTNMFIQVLQDNPDLIKFIKDAV